MARPAPICLTLLLCDQVVWDRTAGKVSLVGTFLSLAADAFPAIVPRCAVWIELTNGHGQTPLVLRFARVTPHDIDGVVLFEAGLTITFTDPRTTHHHVLSAIELALPEPGEYRLSLHAFGLPLFDRRFEIRQLGEHRP